MKSLGSIKTYKLATGVAAQLALICNLRTNFVACLAPSLRAIGNVLEACKGNVLVACVNKKPSKMSSIEDASTAVTGLMCAASPATGTKKCGREAIVLTTATINCGREAIVLTTGTINCGREAIVLTTATINCGREAIVLTTGTINCGREAIVSRRSSCCSCCSARCNLAQGGGSSRRFGETFSARRDHLIWRGAPPDRHGH